MSLLAGAADVVPSTRDQLRRMTSVTPAPASTSVPLCVAVVSSSFCADFKVASAGGRFRLSDRPFA